MKKIYLALVSLLFSSFSFSQTVTTTINYGGFGACSGCQLCGLDYFCFNNPAGPTSCGVTPACDTKTFVDPVPAGNLITNIQIKYTSGNCSGSIINTTINGASYPAIVEVLQSCTCGPGGTNPCGLLPTSSNVFPCGVPSYVYGGVNAFQLCTGSGVCIARVELIFTYVPKEQINPVVTSTTPLTFCQGNNVTLDAGAGYPAYSWSNGATTQTINVSTSGTYTATVTSTTGCTTGNASATVIVNSLPTTITPASGSNTTICSGEQATIIATPVTGVSANVYSTPVGGTLLGALNFTSPTLTSNTVYYIETVSDSGCIAKPKRDSVIVTVNPLPAIPVITSLSNDSVCIGLRDTIQTTPVAGVVTNVYGTATGGIVLGTLNFVTPPIVTNATYYFETKVVSTGCLSKTVRDSITIIVLPRPAKATLALTPNDSICLNDSTMLNATTLPGNTIKWYSTSDTLIAIGNDSVVVAPKATQYFYAEVKNALGCKANEIRDSLKVTVLPLPKAPKILGGVDKICEGDSIVLNAIVTPQTSTIYWLTSLNWTDTIAKGINFTSPILSSSTTYYVAAITKEQCKSLESDFYAVPVIVKPLPHITVSSNAVNNSIYEGESVLFQSNPNTYDMYKWYIDNNEVYVGSYSFETQDIQGNQNIKVLVTNNGCINWADNVLSIKALPLSNAFSPNGDGKNDLFLKGLDLTIFNRWGQLLFEGKQGWDGKYNGATVSAGTYYYMVKIKKTGSTELVERTGALTLITD